ncbi:MAG: two-component system, OmpR family, sensor kinase [Actinomycetota bacterium]|nr:two-component system, OmpR family, sensor kinase [Actinomycetota bacterium]
MTRLRQRLVDVPLWARLVLSLVLIVLIALLATGVTATTAMRGYLLDRVDTQLTQFAGVNGGNDRPGPEPNGGRGRRPDSLNAFYVAYFTTAGEPVGIPIRTDKSPPQLPTITASLVSQKGSKPFSVGSVSGSDDWRVVLTAASDGSGYRAVAINAGGVDGTVHRLEVIELVVGLGVLLLVALGTFAAVRRNLRPLVEVEHTASAIAAGDLTLRVPQRSTRNEVGRLAGALNVMLGQIERAFDAQGKSEAAARQSEQRMRQFVADASHELRTPLTSIRGFAELYRQGAVSDGDEVRGMLRRVEDEASRMGLLVDELLLLARLDQQRPLESTPVDLVPLVTDAVHAAHAAGRDHPIELRIEPGRSPVVIGDEARLRQVIANLLANARTHTPAGTPITVHVGASDVIAFLEVADEGPGMSAEQAARVFERFYRVDPARTRATGGSGLGLSIAAALVHAHGGEIAVDTAPGAGARFRVQLPLAP